MRFVLITAPVWLTLAVVPVIAADAPWIVFGELTGVDFAARRGVCRHEGTNASIHFAIPDDGLLDRLGGPGPAPDYSPSDRLIFEFERGNESGRYRLTGLREEIVQMATRDECLQVDLIETVRWPRLKCSRVKRDRSETFEADYYLEISPDTRFWKSGRPAKWEDVQLGDAVLAKTRGIGFGRVRVAHDIYLDRESWDPSRRP